MTKFVDFVDVRLTGKHLEVRVGFSAKFRVEDGYYLVRCESLRISTQGKTKAEAQANIVEAVKLFIESCIARETLAYQLADRGFKKKAVAATKRASDKLEKLPNKHTETMSIPLSAAQINAIKNSRATPCGLYRS